jgi:hypothetical protein
MSRLHPWRAKSNIGIWKKTKHLMLRLLKLRPHWSLFSNSPHDSENHVDNATPRDRRVSSGITEHLEEVPTVLLSQGLPPSNISFYVKLRLLPRSSKPAAYSCVYLFPSFNMYNCREKFFHNGELFIRSVEWIDGHNGLIRVDILIF